MTSTGHQDGLDTLVVGAIGVVVLDDIATGGGLRSGAAPAVFATPGAAVARPPEDVVGRRVPRVEQTISGGAGQGLCHHRRRRRRRRRWRWRRHGQRSRRSRRRRPCRREGASLTRVAPVCLLVQRGHRRPLGTPPPSAAATPPLC